MKRFTMDEARLRDLWATDATCKQIAAEFGCSGALVSKRALELGLPRRATDPTQLPERKIIAAYRDHGMTMEAIRDELRKQFPKLSVQAIRNLLIAYRIPLRPRAYRRGQPGRTYVAECVKLARERVPYHEIGRKFGLSARQVARRVRMVLPPLAKGRASEKFPLEAILAAYQRHGTFHGAAREIGCHWSSVRYHWRKHQAQQRQAVAS